MSVTVTSGLLLISQMAEGPAPYRSPLGPVAYWSAGPRARASAAAGGVPSPLPSYCCVSTFHSPPGVLGSARRLRTSTEHPWGADSYLSLNYAHAPARSAAGHDGPTCDCEFGTVLVDCGGRDV